MKRIILFALTIFAAHTLQAKEPAVKTSQPAVTPIAQDMTEPTDMMQMDQQIMSMNKKMKKYVFKPYRESFPKLFLAEKARILSAVDCVDIQHVGSSAVPGLGGKGIIDIAIAVSQEDFAPVAEKLSELGYFFHKDASVQERWFFRADLPDEEEGIRRYHIHLTFLESSEWKNLLAFRDYLRSHPDVKEEYAQLKKAAAESSNEEGAEYRRLKAPIFKRILDEVRRDDVDS